jgi:two-component system phosphate regulon response regulator PhoB
MRSRKAFELASPACLTRLESVAGGAPVRYICVRSTSLAPILIIEDEKDIVDLIAYHLKQSGFSVTAALDGPSGLEKAKRERPSLIILDLMLPGIEGKDICRNLKSNPVTRSIPVLMLTAKAEEVDRIVGFELGADDYVTKPFSPRELVLRVKAILRRKEAGPEGEKVIQVRDLSIDIDRHEVLVKQEAVQLTSTEFKLLVELASRRGRVQTREYLLDKVWGYTYEGYARTVDTHIRRLREKLGPAGDYIETIRGVGYRFREDLK